MPSVLGKRKARSHEKSSATKADTQQDPQDIFRRLFEQRFTPLEPAPSTRRPKHAAPTTAHDDSDDFDDDDTDEDGLDSDEDGDTDLDDDEDGAGSEWGGVSDADGDSIDGSDEVEVVDHSCNPLASDAAPSMTKQELKAYMSSRPPSITTESKQQPPPQGRKSKKTAATAEDSADLLANDLALQRLLSESHLLSAATAGHASSSATLLSSVAATPAAGSAAFAQGRLRRRTADLRMQALGSRESVFAQPAMPLAIRRGIAQHRAAREQRRRREARECGVILEAPSSSSSSAKSRAGGGGGGGGGGGARRGGPKVGMPGVGKMRGAELRISARDVRDIEGRKAGPDKKKKKKRR
ncbi:hypothetical protein RB594_007453 [Gaeumannomyces avenae]